MMESRTTTASAGRQARALRTSCVAAALAVTMAAAPALAQNTAYAARKVGDNYVFDVELPPKFLTAITTPSAACYNTAENTLTSGGKTQIVRTTEISWDQNLSIGKGRFAFSNQGGFGGECWQAFETTDVAWADFKTRLEAMATGGNGSPSRVVLYHRPAEKGAPVLTLSDQEIAKKLAAPFKPAPLPDKPLPGESAQGLKVRQDLVATLNTVKPGGYFPDDVVLVPSNLAATREAMLRYGNTERRNPQFRAGIPTAQPVVKGQKFTLGSTQFDVVDQGDLTLNDRLNETAQWFAEALATGQGSAHTFTGSFTVDGKVVDMKEFWKRGEYFKAGPLAGEVSAWGGPGDLPYGWMASNTHLAWWFGVGGPYKEVGFGAARDRKGSWHYVAVANK